MSTVRVTIYRAGPIESWLLKRMDSSENTIAKAIWRTLATGAGACSRFTEGVVKKTKRIRFTKIHAKAWGLYQLNNLAFVSQGTIGIITLGLITPSFTRRTTTPLARALKDVQIFEAGEIVEANEDLPQEEQKRVPKYLEEAAKRQKMTREELAEEMDRKLAELDKK